MNDVSEAQSRLLPPSCCFPAFLIFDPEYGDVFTFMNYAALYRGIYKSVFRCQSYVTVICIVQEVSIPKTETACSPETMVPTYENTRCHIPEDDNHVTPRCGTLKSDIKF